MTISDFLKLPNFTDLRLLAGKYGLLSEVTNVTVVDTPDGTNWLNGGELVITTAYMLHEEKDLLEFLRTLSSKKAAGVGIKENRYLTEIPESARKLADELHLPLISVPEAYPFVDIINPVLTQIINQQSFLLTQANMIHKEFLSLAINNNSGLESIKNDAFSNIGTLETVTIRNSSDAVDISKAGFSGNAVITYTEKSISDSVGSAISDEAGAPTL